MLSWGERIALGVVAVMLILSGFGSHCSTRRTLDTIRQVHSCIREAGRRVDDQVASRIERQGDICIERAAEAGFPADSGEAGMAYWRQCMEDWYEFSVAVNSLRNSLEELENIYNDIEAGDRGESDWQYWARRVLDHGRTVLRLLGGIGGGICLRN